MTPHDFASDVLAEFMVSPLISAAAHLDIGNNPNLSATHLELALTTRRAIPKTLILDNIDNDERLAARIVSRCDWLPYIERLDVSGAFIGANEARALAAARGLRHLACRDCDMGPLELATLAKGLSEQLRTLDMIGNDITNEAVMEMAALDWPCLYEIRLGGSPSLTRAGVDELVRSPFLPYLRTIWWDEQRIDVQTVRATAGMRFID